MEIIIEIFFTLLINIAIVVVSVGLVEVIFAIKERIQVRRKNKEDKKGAMERQKRSDMSIEEIIDTLQVAISEVEWEYPLNYAVTFEEAIKILKKYKRKEKTGN